MARSSPDDDFAMSWEVDPKAAKRLADIADALKGADGVILATDPDREGEAISWHVLEVLQTARRRSRAPSPSSGWCSTPSPRPAVTRGDEAIPRDIDMELVEAYLARRALDYLVGFTLSPVLWRKLPGSPLGRPRAVGLRCGSFVEREMEIEALQDPGILERRGQTSRPAPIRSWPGW
jgi:DNA topoisomerase I